MLACCVSAGIASASSIFSFTGTFTTDDQLEIFQFTAPTSAFQAETLSYGGGTNGDGQVIPAGGFEPYLSLFDSSGTLVATDYDGPGGNTDPNTGYALDSLLAISTLTPGATYTLILTENNNEPVGSLPPGSSYSDIFTEAGQGDFTATEFPCGGTAFCDSYYDQRNGNWALDISGVASAVDTSAGSTPEPGSILLLSTGLASLALRRRSGKHV
jgi:hypothetical protein